MGSYHTISVTVKTKTYICIIFFYSFTYSMKHFEIFRIRIVFWKSKI